MNGKKTSRKNGNGRSQATNGNGGNGSEVIAASPAASMSEKRNGNGNGHRNGNGHDAAAAAAVRAMIESAEAPDLRAALRAADGNGEQKKHYDCLKCPAYCCSYVKINVGRRDLSRLAKHFGLEFEIAQERFTKIVDGEQVLRHRKDEIYGSVCMFLDREERRCTIYEARPGVCREYPDRPRCGYYDFLRWERRHQDDGEFVPLRME